MKKVDSIAMEKTVFYGLLVHEDRQIILIAIAIVLAAVVASSFAQALFK